MAARPAVPRIVPRSAPAPAVPPTSPVVKASVAPPPPSPQVAAAPVATAPAIASPASTQTSTAVPQPTSSAGGAPARSLDEAQTMRRVLADLQRQVDLVLEVRLRELLAPILSRAADALIRDARKELTTAMRDAVSRAIAQELARRQDRGPH
jgi:hypothetical protein